MMEEESTRPAVAPTTSLLLQQDSSQQLSANSTHPIVLRTTSSSSPRAARRAMHPCTAFLCPNHSSLVFPLMCLSPGRLSWNMMGRRVQRKQPPRMWEEETRHRSKKKNKAVLCPSSDKGSSRPWYPGFTPCPSQSTGKAAALSLLVAQS